MKYIKRFDEDLPEFPMGDDMSRSRVQKHDRFDEFYGKYKDLIDFSEEDFDQGEEPSNIDLYSELGELCLRYDFSKEDAQYILDTYDCSFDVDSMLQSTIDNWVD